MRMFRRNASLENQNLSDNAQLQMLRASCVLSHTNLSVFGRLLGIESSGMSIGGKGKSNRLVDSCSN